MQDAPAFCKFSCQHFTGTFKNYEAGGNVNVSNEIIYYTIMLFNLLLQLCGLSEDNGW